ncbi:dynein axonemal heavy chain 2-like [Drosophila willistoni]|uniref:dynein axonemal heavy chain 2-like n=1 Tax=Drosophila willistoni TaxID=7260 RepID=UPI001F083503|nr:dynein axonemal heavy chain 2-like [Drosophila willistoni]
MRNSPRGNGSPKTYREDYDYYYRRNTVPVTLDNMELTELVKSVQRMTVLYSLDQCDWNENVIEIIKLWLLKVTESTLTIFYDCNILTACLGFPVAPVIDLSYFVRQSHQAFTVESFHECINFGTIHDDVDGTHLRILELVYAPVFKSYSEWGDNVKQRFCKSLDRYLSFITRIYFRMSGMTVLYVPYVVHQIVRENIYDREFVKNLEAIAVSWATQIRSLLNDKTLTVPSEFVAVDDEYEFWLYRLVGEVYEMCTVDRVNFYGFGFYKEFLYIITKNEKSMPKIKNY